MIEGPEGTFGCVVIIIALTVAFWVAVVAGRI